MSANPTDGAEIVREAYELIVGPRQDAYSHPAEDYTRTAAIFNAITGHDLTTEEAVLFMVAVKLSRLQHEMNAGQWLPDNTRDAIGYLGCLNMVRESERQFLIEFVNKYGSPISPIRKPNGGRGKGRIGKLTWNHPAEIAQVVDLMRQAEDGYRDGTFPELDTKLKREAWVAQQTDVWSAGTVHIQLQLARDKGLLPATGETDGAA